MKSQLWKQSLLLVAAGILSVGFGLSQATVSKADLVLSGTYGDTGEGYGAVGNILSLHKSGGTGTASDVEAGTVYWDGSATQVIGVGKPTGNNPDGTYAIDTTFPDTTAGKTDTFTFDYAGITDATQIGLIWDASEVGSTAGEKNVIDELTLSIYDPDGNDVFDASIANPYEFDTLTNPGLGAGDWLFVLDTAEAADLNSILTGVGDFSDYRIGLAASVSFVDDGQDTFILMAGPGSTPPPPPNPVPEPATMLLFGIGLAGAGAVRRRRNK